MITIIDNEQKWVELERMSSEYLKLHEQVLKAEDSKINCLIFSVIVIALLLMINTYHNLN